MNNALIDSLIREHMMAWSGFVAERYATDNVNFETPSDGIWYRLTVQHGINLMVGMACQHLILGNKKALSDKFRARA